MRTLALILLSSVFLGGTALALDESVVVQINSLNGSGETGTATLLPEGKQTKVVITLLNTPPGVAQPAHIHLGRCNSLDPKPKWPLNPIESGRSVTTIPVSIDEIERNPTAINVHESQYEIKKYVACGDIIPTY